ncbi:peptidase [Nocardia terpenica]|uniref:Peptidase n=2 Tax=Nocardia terpenica TaxID=455432 RepID=A0A164IY19_9NOCA|nr:peptidase [Nocardia terpenica]
MPRFMLKVVVFTAVALICVPFLSNATLARAADGFTGPDGGSYAAAWTASVDGPQPFPDMTTDLSVPITMSDGTVLKADVYHPATGNRPAEGRFPVILQMQGYGKLVANLGQILLKIPGVEQVLLPWISSLNFPGSGLDGITDLTRQLDSGVLRLLAQDWALVHAGYTLVQVDMRGTGASEGKWQVFGDREKLDAKEVIDWAARQPWSDGKVGLTGTSFTGISALEATAHTPEALRAIFAGVPSTDVFRDIAGAGGATGLGFLSFWLLGVDLVKNAPDLESVLSGRFDPAQQLQWLKDRLADPFTMLDVLAGAYGSTAWDHLPPGTKAFLDPNSPIRQGLKTDLSKVTMPTFVLDASFDIFGTTPMESFEKVPLPLEQKKLIMGDGYHLFSGVAGFGHPGMPPRVDVLQRAWFDKWLRGTDNGIDKYSPLTVKRQGGGWETITQSPQAESDYRRMYLTDAPSGTAGHAVADGSLSPRPNPAGVHDFSVAPSLLSLCSRDMARITGGATSVIVACTEDSRIWEHSGLAFTSGAVTAATQISGPIAVHLNVVHDAPDGYWVATVNDVAPDGQSREISSGQLVSSLRKIDDAQSSRSPNGDYTIPVPFVDINQREPVIPGQPLTLDIALTPIEAVLQPGHRLRVDVYASNGLKGVPTLPTLAASGLRPQTLRLDPATPSWVNIAVNNDIPE